MVSLLSREGTVGVLDATAFREIRDLILFHVFFSPQYYRQQKEIAAEIAFQVKIILFFFFEVQ